MWGALIGAGMSLLSNKASADAQEAANKPTAQELQSLDQALAQHQRHTQVYRPLEEGYINLAQNLGDTAHINRIAGGTNATGMNSLSQGLGAMNTSGIDPSRGAYQRGAGDLIANGMAQNAYDMAGASMAARENMSNGLLNAARMGNNINGAAMAGMNTAANLSANTAATQGQTLADFWQGGIATGRNLIDYDTRNTAYDNRRNTALR
jgi:hypothetical protein